jgi:hypothetical protein
LQWAARATLKNIILQQRDEMLQSFIVTSDASLQGTHQSNRFEQVTQALKQVELHSRNLLKIWKPVLPAYLNLTCCGWLIGEILQQCVEYILAMTDIEAEESAVLYKLLLGTEGDEMGLGRRCAAMLDEELAFQSRLDALKVRHHKRSDSASSTATTGLQHGSCVLIPHYEKFKAVIQVLDMNLADILATFRNGRYHDVGLVMPTELVGLVKALFSDGTPRRKAIAEIEGFDAHKTAL